MIRDQVRIQIVNHQDSPISKKSISVIIPTYQEAGSLPTLLDRIAAIRDSGCDLEVIVVDDDSRDGTEELFKRRGNSWERLIVRRTERGLSSAVLRGMDESKHDVLLVMDADGSHPPEAIPAMAQALHDGADFSVGSRYVPGGSTEDGWGVLRWINSKIATIMARPFTSVRDPMSGFFCIARSTWKSGAELDPIGYKIGLELIVKCRCEKVVEVPIHFSTRREGESKLTLRVQWEYLLHIVNLCRFKYPGLSSFLPFALVGLSGIAVYVGLLAVLGTFWSSDETAWLRILVAVLLTMTWNFAWDRRLAFWDARGSIVRQYFGFVAICAIPLLVTYFATYLFARSGEETAGIGLPAAGLIGSIIGSAFGLIFNWFCNRWLVFRRAK